MMHQIRSFGILSTPSPVTQQEGSAQKRPRSFYSSSIKTWASRYSEHNGNLDDCGPKTGVGRCDDIRNSVKHMEGDGTHGVNGFSAAIHCETVGDKSSTSAKNCSIISNEGVTGCDVLISDSDDEVVDSQRPPPAKRSNSSLVSKSDHDITDSRKIQRPQEPKKANSNRRSEPDIAVFRRAKRPRRVKKTTSYSSSESADDSQTATEMANSDPCSDSDDDRSNSQKVQRSKKANSHFQLANHRSKVRNKNNLQPSKKVTLKTTSVKRQSSEPIGLILEIDSDDGDAESSVNITPSLKSNVDISSCPPSADRSPSPARPRRPPIIEIDSDSCSSVSDGPSKTIALQSHSISPNIENKEVNKTATLPLPTSCQQNPPAGMGVIGFQNIPVPAPIRAPIPAPVPVRQYSNFQGVFKNYCGNDKASTPAASSLSNGGAQLNISGDGLITKGICAANLNQEQVLAFLKSGKFSLQFIAGVPVLCPVRVTPVNIALPFESSGLQPSLKTTGGIFMYRPSLLQSNALGYGTVRMTVPSPVSMTTMANSVGNGTQRRPVASVVRRALPGAQFSSSGARNGAQALPKANISKTFVNKAASDVGNRQKIKMTLYRKRTRISKDSPSKMGKSKVMTQDPNIAKVKDIIDETKRAVDRTDKNMKKPMDTAEKTKKEGERPVAKALIGLAMQLVSKQVIVGLIKVTKRTLEKKPEDKIILTKLQNRHAELKYHTRAFELNTKECRCGKLKTESSNIFLEHLQRGSSPNLYKCCLCMSVMKSHRVFRQHMARKHNILGSSKLVQPKNYSCSYCPFETNHRLVLEFHSEQCLTLLQKEEILHPRLEDFDIPILYDERDRRQIAKQVTVVANIGSKTNQFGQVNLDVGVLCLTCGQSFSNLHALRRHRKSAHKIPEPKLSGTPLKQSTPSQISENRTPSCKSKSSGTPLMETTPSKIPGNRTPSCKNKSSGTPLMQTTPSKIPGNSTPLSTDIVSPQTAASLIKCCLCDELLGREMVQHFRIQHLITLNAMAKKHFCYFCDCSLANYTCFEEHMISAHKGIFPDMKTLWNKILASVISRERDTIIAYNTTENSDAVARPWKCLQCEQRFLSSSDCYRHAVAFHTTEKVECQLCPKMIATGATYTQHLEQCHIQKCSVMIRQLSASRDHSCS